MQNPNQDHHPFELPPLPWPENALEPVTSARTVALHHGKHHAAYVKKLNELVAGTRFAEQSLEHIIAATVGGAESQKIFNNAAQTWNHTFFWNCLRPKGGGDPPRAIGKLLDDSFGGVDKFRERFAQSAVDCFGSGWAWLVARGGKLEILATSNANNPLTMGATPLLTIDVWEHAYYIDHENRRPEFVKAVIDKLLNWEWAEQQLDRAKVRKAA